VNAERILINPLGRIPLLVIAVLLLYALSCGCSNEGSLVDYGGDPIAKVRALESENTRLQSENQNKSEQLAVLNAKIPGGLSLGEREKQLQQKESRLKELETRLQEQEGSLLQVESKLKEDRGKLQVDQKQFHSEKEERLIQIGEANQMVARYESVVKEKDDAVSAERLANQRVEEFVRCVTVAICVALAAVLFALTFVVRNRMQRKHIDSAMRTVEYGDLPLAMKEQIAHRLGRELPRLGKHLE
jgi:TolA-binding protein